MNTGTPGTPTNIPTIPAVPPEWFTAQHEVQILMNQERARADRARTDLMNEGHTYFSSSSGETNEEDESSLEEDETPLNIPLMSYETPYIYTQSELNEMKELGTLPENREYQNLDRVYLNFDNKIRDLKADRDNEVNDRERNFGYLVRENATLRKRIEILENDLKFVMKYFVRI